MQYVNLISVTLLQNGQNGLGRFHGNHGNRGIRENFAFPPNQTLTSYCDL